MRASQDRQRPARLVLGVGGRENDTCERFFSKESSNLATSQMLRKSPNVSSLNVWHLKWIALPQKCGPSKTELQRWDMCLSWSWHVPVMVLTCACLGLVMCLSWSFQRFRKTFVEINNCYPLLLCFDCTVFHNWMAQGNRPFGVHWITQRCRIDLEEILVLLQCGLYVYVVKNRLTDWHQQ